MGLKNIINDDNNEYSPSKKSRGAKKVVLSVRKLNIKNGLLLPGPMEQEVIDLTMKARQSFNVPEEALPLHPKLQ